jgi:tetratricopeptide (TPR) repeat protein
VRTLAAAALLVSLGAPASHAYEEEPDLSPGEWMLLEGRTEDAVKWYRARYAKRGDAAMREKLVEALTARSADLLGEHRVVEAQRLLEEARGLTRKREQTERIRHLIAYAEKRTTGHAIDRGHRALASGNLEAARTAYAASLEAALDDFERRQSKTLLALLGLLESALGPGAEEDVQRAMGLWPTRGGSTEDVQQFLWVARVNRSLGDRLRAAADRLESDGREGQVAIRTVALCLLLRTREAREALSKVQKPGWREPLEALTRQAERLERAGGEPGG